MGSEWLDNLKCGDTVIVDDDRKSIRVDSITHATATTVKVGIYVFQRKTGRYPKSQQSSFGPWPIIKEPTPELIAKAHDQLLRRKLTRMLRDMNVEKLSLAAVQHLLAAIKELGTLENSA